jgi:hypothetical protein
MEKEIVGNTGYAIEQDINISGTHYIFAIDDKEKMRYLVADNQVDELFNKYYNCIVSDDYLSAMAEWNSRVKVAIEKCQKEISEVKDYQILKADDVEPISPDTSILNKVVVIRPEVLLREAQYSQKQLMFVVGGFGADGHSRGRAVMCNRIDDDAHLRFNRSDVLGVIKSDKVPNWAKEKISALQKSNSEPITVKGPTVVNPIRR